MKNLVGATQSAIFRTLKQLEQDADLTALLGQKVGVYTHVKQDTQPPIIKIGQISSESEAEGYDQVERITMEIYGIWRGLGNGKLLEMMHGVRALLDGQHIESDDAVIQPPYFLSLEVGDAAVDGNTYVAVMNFEMLVEPT